MSELEKVANAPLVTTNSESRTPPKAMNGLPLAFWHIRQWQILTPVGSAIRRKRTAPHCQPPPKPTAASIPNAVNLPGNALSERLCWKRHEGLRAGAEAREMRRGFRQHTLVEELGEDQFRVKGGGAL